MASNEAKRKLTKSEKTQLLSERGRSGAEARGCGVGSRQDFVLPAQWETEDHVYPSHVAKKIVISPGKTRYHSMKKVNETLKKRKMDLCISDASASSEEESISDVCSSEDEMSESVEIVEPVVQRQLCVGESSQITAFVDDVNRCSKCSTVDCNGK